MVDGLARDARRGGFAGLGGFGHYVDFFQAEGALRQHIILSDTPFDGDFFRYVLVPDELDDQLVGSRVQALEGIVAFGVGIGMLCSFLVELRLAKKQHPTEDNWKEE